MSFKKYLWKCRLLVLNTPNYIHPEYKRSKDLYQKEIKGFHKRYIKLVTKLDKSKKFKVTLIGFDGTCLLYTSPSPRDDCPSRMPSSA